MIEVAGLVKSYEGCREPALKGVSFRVDEGECFGLLGPNGAGKTTIMGCLTGLLHPDDGSITISGLDPCDLAIREQLGFLPERPNFETWFTARQFLSYHHRLAARPSRDRGTDVERTLRLVKLDEKAWDRKIKTFSRGMIQRIGLAQSLIGEPRFLFLDEPGSGMDPPGVTLLREILQNLKRDGVTVVLNSHHLDEMERVCDRVAFISSGEIRSIKTLGGPDDVPHVLRLKWLDGNLDREPGVDKILAEIAEATGSTLIQRGASWARVAVPDAVSAAELIRRAIASDINLHSASPESTTLERLFEVSDNPDIVNSGGTQENQ